MNNLHQRFTQAAYSPKNMRPPHVQQEQDPFSGFGYQELSNLINAAANALRNRGYSLPPPPAFTITPMHSVPTQNRLQTNTPPSQQVEATPRSTLTATTHPARIPDMWENAKVEQIICSGLKPPFDGSAENLIPTLNLINIQRRNEVWFSATILKQDGKDIDLITQFSQVTAETINQHSKLLWDAPDAQTQSHIRGTATYNNRLLGVFLMNSLTQEFAALLHTRIDIKYCSDGALLLHTMCQHIHRNHLAFVKSIKSKIRSSQLTDFNNDVPKFLRYLHSNLWPISSTDLKDKEQSDLIPHILHQLRGTTMPIFQQSVLKWQREYFENTLPLTPHLLISKADAECQVLTHAGQWVETSAPSITALKATLKANTTHSGEILKTIVANFSQLHQRNRDHNHWSRPTTRPSSRSSSQLSPEWVQDPPTYPDQIRHYYGRYWHFCSKCGQQGRWVCTHTDSTHDDNAFSTRRSPMPDQ